MLCSTKPLNTEVLIIDKPLPDEKNEKCEGRLHQQHEDRDPPARAGGTPEVSPNETVLRIVLSGVDD